MAAQIVPPSSTVKTNPTVIAQLEAERARFTGALRAPTTESGYKYDQRAFRTWTAKMGFECVPCSPDVLGLWVTSMLVGGLKVSTCGRRIAAVVRLHKSNGLASPATEEVRDLLRGARRLRQEQVDQVLPLLIEELREISVKLLGDDGPISIRNWCMLLVGFSAALRNSNTAALLLSDIEFVEKGVILKLRRSKTDQFGRGRLIGLAFGKHPETCPVIALKRWIERRGSFAGPLFTRFDGHPPRDRPLLPERIGQIVQECICLVGLDCHLYGGHSLRAGFTTAAGLSGAPELLIAATTGHRDMSTLRGYFRRRDAFAGNVSGLLDL
jgi:integrase